MSVNTVWWSKWEELLYSLSWECVKFLVQFMLGSGSVFEFSDPKSGFGSRLQKAWIQIRIRIHGSKKGGSNGFRIRFRIRIQSPDIFYVWLRSLYVHFRMKRNIKDTEWRGKIIYKINIAITQPQLSTLIISPFLVNYILLTLENEQKYQRYWM